MKTIRCIFAAALFACSHFLSAQTPALFGQVRVTGSEVIGANQVPATTLQVIDTGTSTPRGITHDQYSTGTNSAQINTRKARGTVAAPTTVVSGDVLGRHIFWGYDGTNFIESGNIRYTSSGTIAATRVPGQLEFYTSTDALPSVLTLAATINAAQNLVLVNPLAATSGGTGLASFTVGDIFYANTTTTLAKLTAGTSGFFLQTQGAGAAPIWAAESGTGTGDVSGPGSSTNTAIARFNGTSGKNIQNSQATLDGSGNMASVTSITSGAATDLTVTGNSGAILVLGNGANGAATLTPAGSGSLVVGPSSLTNKVLIGAYTGNTSFPAISFSGTLADATLAGLLYNSSNGDLYFQNGASTSAFYWRFANSEKMRISPSNFNLLIGGSTDISGSGGLKVFGSTDSSSTSTGSIQTLGGVGVAKNLVVGGSSTFNNNVLQNRSANAQSLIQVSNNNSGTSASSVVQSDNSAYTVAIEMPGQSYTTNGPRVANRGYLWSDGAQGFTIHAINGPLKFWTGNTGSEKASMSTTAFTTSLPTSITDATASTSTTTGALVINGGLGVLGATWIGGAIVPSQTNGITGTTTNNSVSAGGVGEFVESLVAIGSPQSLSNNTAANVTSINLTAGDWDVTAIGSFTETASTVSARTAGISSTSATLPTDGSEGYCGVQSVVTSETNSITLARKRLSLSGTTTVYLVEKANFSAGTCGGFGEISARRVR